MAKNPTVKVKSHKRKDGTPVKSHIRSEPDKLCSNNLKPKKCKK